MSRVKTRSEVVSEVEAELRDALAKLGGEGFGLPLEEQPVVPLDRISTGSLKLDRALGGGIPRGRITEIFGPESQGKTTICYSIMGQAQAQGLAVAFVDAEQTWDAAWAAKFGVDPAKVWHVQPSSGNEALEAVRAFTAKGCHGLVVVDSVAALVPEAELRGEIGDAVMGAQARMMSQALRIITPLCAENNVALIFTNQLREKIGQMFGNPETTTGGKALKFYASMRLSVRKRGDFIKEGDTPVGMLIRVVAQKNKTAPPFQDAELRLLFESGFDFVGEALDFAVEQGILEKSGAWYSYAGERWQGRDRAIEWLKANPTAYTELTETLQRKDTNEDRVH